jgi:hypothetical protein
MSYYEYDPSDFSSYLEGDYLTQIKILSIEEKREKLQPLIRQIKRFDRIKNEVMNQAVSIRKLGQLAEILNEQIDLFPEKEDIKCNLLNYKSLNDQFWMEDLDNVKLEVRRGYMHMPMYYLCDAKSNYFGNYGIVLEDYYLSPGYTFEDPRFTRLMHHGHELYFIRMSGFRKEVEKLFEKTKSKQAKKTDKLLLDVGKHFLQGAWHEDQVIAWMMSEHFKLLKFKQAMELIYFSLGSEFCDVRQEITPEIKLFFRQVYKQPALLALIEKIETSEGNAFLDLETKSRELYTSVSKAFSNLLQCDIKWGMVQKRTIPLYKVVFSNIYRLDLVVKTLQENEAVHRNCQELEKVAGEAIEALVV